MKRLFTLILSLMLVVSLQARDNGQFFKKLTGKNIAVENIEQRFAEWFSLPENTEWREVSHTTDFAGMERIEYRQYVAGVEVEHSQVLIHAKDGKVRTANGMVMEVRRAPARIRRHNPIINDGTANPKDKQLYLVNTKNGFRYAYKELSANKREWIYYDVETLEVIKRVAIKHRFRAADDTAVQVKGLTIYNGEVMMDASQAADGSTYLFDPVRNIHTLNAAYIPTLSSMSEQGILWNYFPQGDMPNDINDATEDQVENWGEMIEEMLNNNELEHFTNYITDFAQYFGYKQGQEYYGYRITDLSISYLTVKDEEGNLIPFTPNDDDDDDDWGDDDWDEDWNVKARSNDSDDDDWDDDDDDDWGDIDFGSSPSVCFTLMYGSDPENHTKAIISQMLIDFEDIEELPYELNLLELFEQIPPEGGIMYLVMSADDEEVMGDTLAVLHFVPDESGRFELSNDRIGFSFNYEKAGHPIADIHWGMAKTLDFYKEVFGRDSYDGNGAPVYNLYYNLPENEDSFLTFPVDNAAALSTNAPYPMLYGTGGLGLSGLLRPVVELSVMAHEFTHIVTGHTADLEYSGESGALNESFSDIFGISVKKYVNNAADWYIGEGVVINEEGGLTSNLRNMADPKNSMDGEDHNPDTYEGEFWVDIDEMGNDNGGVHTNSAVQNKWFYLLTDGAVGTNDNGFVYDVKGIGIEKSREIAYLTLTSYATSESDYAAIRMASQEAAEVLYGAGSNELKAVADAWDAVGVAESDITGIERIYETDAQAGRIFDLQGRALPGLPTEAGIYIINGKKVVIK